VQTASKPRCSDQDVAPERFGDIIALGSDPAEELLLHAVKQRQTAGWRVVFNCLCEYVLAVVKGWLLRALFSRAPGLQQVYVPIQPGARLRRAGGMGFADPALRRS
jgi:hypothetical protein